MTLEKSNTFMFIIIIIFVSNSNVEASNSTCLQEWKSMGAQTAVGNMVTNDSIKISLTVEGLAIYNQYRGNYSATIKLAGNDEDYGFLNNEPIFVQEIGMNCIWKQDTGMWWVGKCDEIGENKGFAFMNNCDCPWPSINDDIYDDNFEKCNKCTWTKYTSKEKFSCNKNVDLDYNYEINNLECQFGIGFKREDYGPHDWVGNKCYSSLNINVDNVGEKQNTGVKPSHNQATAKLGQLVNKFKVPSSAQKCRIAGGKLRRRRYPRPHIIICKFPTGNLKRRTQ